MKALKVVIVLIAVACIMPALIVQEAQAAAGWATVYVNKAGQAWDVKYAVCTDATGTMPALNAVYYPLTTTWDASAMLTTALTAMASGMKVQIYATDLATGQIVAMFLLDK